MLMLYQFGRFVLTDVDEGLERFFHADDKLLVSRKRFSLKT